MSQYNTDELTMGNLISIVNHFFKTIITLCFTVIKYLYKNKVIVSLLLILGVGIGYYLDNRSGKNYKNEIIVAPKFGSTDYLYETVANYKFDIKTIDPKYSDNITNIELTAFEDIYSFTSQNSINLETFKILAENGDVKKLLSDQNNYRNYKYHKLTIYTNTPNSKEIVNAYLKHLNSNTYFKERQAVSFKNLQLKIDDYKQSINQINIILDNFGSKDNSSQSNSFNINTDSQINEIIKTKANLVDNLNWLETDLIEQKNIIFPVSQNLNIEVNKFILLRKMVVLPILFLGLFLLFGLVKKLYEKYGK